MQYITIKMHIHLEDSQRDGIKKYIEISVQQTMKYICMTDENGNK